jgi:hypothetical protein
MRITRKQLRKIIKESLLLEAEMLPILVNPYEDLETLNRIANYALTNDIEGALADPMVNYEGLDYDLDAMNGWVKYVGDENEKAFSDHAVVPDNWDEDAVYKFMKDLESAWMNQQGDAADDKHQSDPDPEAREVIGHALTMEYIPLEDVRYITYQVRRKGGKLSNINIEYSNPNYGGTDYANIQARDADSIGMTLDDIESVLVKHGAKGRKRRKSLKHTPPMYD